ncbi:uncharacterized protein DMENIID0001_155670 [Sergentomyia squamirostris]
MILLYLEPLLCGMRRPSLEHHDGDLSRLTSASSPAEGSLAPCPSDDVKVDIAPSYLPKIIEPLDWQNTRKRKERQDSTSSQTQDRKLVRSNSAEHISSTAYDVIRRVSSHEDFKKPLPPRVTTLEPAPTTPEITVSVEAELSPSHDGRRKEADGSSDGEHERRRSSERFSRTRAPPGRKALSPRKPGKHAVAKLRDRDENLYKYDNSALKHERRGFVSRQKEVKVKETDSGSELLSPVSDFNDNNLIDLNEEAAESQKTHGAAPSEVLPWNVPFHEDSPVVCPRFADNTFDHVHNSSEHKVRSVPSLSEMKTGKFTSLENLKTRDLMKKMPNVAITPDERVKQINSRLSKLKKRVAQFEENFEKDYGYKPPRIETLNDKAMKSIVTEIQKLKREKQCIKNDPIVGLVDARDFPPTSTGQDKPHGDIKLSQMQETLTDIEMILQERRKEEDRSEVMEEMTVDQLMLEKTAIQRGLLYLESIYGRPNSREERDLARPIYDRYRQIKRMLNRSSVLNGAGIGVIELPTILEHEAMAFTVSTATPSTDITPPSAPSAVESPSDTTTMSSSKSTDSTEESSSSVNDNVHTLSIHELWQQLDTVRDEKRDLRRTIKEFEHTFEKENGRKMLKSDRKAIEETYSLYKQKKGKLRLLDALVKKHMSY